MLIVEDTSRNDIIVILDMPEIKFRGQKNLFLHLQFRYWSGV